MTASLDRSRRQLLRTAFAAVGVAWLSACGAGGGADAAPAALATANGAGSAAPSPVLPSADPLAWQIAPDQTLALSAGTTTTIATGALGMTAKVSPELPAGRTLAVTAEGHVVIVAAADAPPVDVLGPWVVEVSG